MNPDIFPPVLKWRVPSSLLTDSIKEMKEDGLLGNEGIVLWLGRRNQGQAEITHLVSLRCKGVIRSPANLKIDSSVINDLTDIAVKRGVILIGQIHSHGPGYGIELSYSDRTYGVAVPGYLSVVAPDYALRQLIRWNDCGVFVYENEAGFKSFNSREIKRRITLVTDIKPTLITICRKDDGRKHLV
jgi:proteasome lid subunit RPN8/RPN11